jgi:hypothetical protein
MIINLLEMTTGSEMNESTVVAFTKNMSKDISLKTLFSSSSSLETFSS